MKHLGLLALLALVAIAARTTHTSGATFVAHKQSALSTVASAQDWSPPSVKLTDPGTPLRGSVTLSAAASDLDGVSAVAFERSRAGAGSWTLVATDTTSPYTAVLDTGTLADGLYDLRAVATDRAGETARSVIGARLVDNTAPSVAVTDPGAFLRGTVTLTATAEDAGSGVASVRIQRALAGSATWTDVCTDTAAPHACTLDTTQTATDAYDLRAIATDAAGNARTSAHLADVQIDNVLPVVTMTDPGSPLSGTVTLAATASDADSGIDRVVIQRSPAGAGTWTGVCSVTVSPAGCRVDTTALPDGLYDLRAIAHDLAGNLRTSTVVTARRVDNTVSSVSMEDPGQYLAGAVTLTAGASSTSGVRQVAIQWSPAGAATWTAACVDVTAPYSCVLDTTAGATPKGSYDFRAVMLTAAEATLTSAVVAGRTIDNSPVSGFDVQAANAAGGTAGRAEPGDRLLLWWTKPVLPATLVPGWSGTGTAAVWVRLADNSANGNDDLLSVWADSGLRTATGFGTVAMRGNFIRTGRTIAFASQVALATAQVDGAPASVATITLGAASSGGLRTWTGSTALVWSPSAGAADAAGNKSSTAPVAERGALDRDF